MSELHDITTLLDDLDAGRPGAMDDLMARVYGDLERVATNQLRAQFGDRAGQITIEPAALVNESFLRLIEQRNRYDNRGHFFAVATKAMFRVLIDYARARQAAKRGGDWARVTLSFEPGAAASRDPVDLIGIEDLEHALDALDRLDRRKADIVRMKVLWSMDVPRIARSLGTSESTVARDWAFARAWLAEYLDGDAEPH